MFTLNYDDAQNNPQNDESANNSINLLDESKKFAQHVKRSVNDQTKANDGSQNQLFTVKQIINEHQAEDQARAA